jgi:squalene-hopene/tetraprenyl-beta-curcumene cyclase
MMTYVQSLVCGIGLVFFSFGIWAAEQSSRALRSSDVSFRNEVQHAIGKGLDWLAANQNTNGYWSTAEHTALTALALTAVNGDPSGRFAKEHSNSVSKAYAFILRHVKPDGSIWKNELANYNTSLSLLALVSANDPQYETAIRNARRWLVGQQVDLGERGKLDTPFDGGVGYGSKYQHSDMNNTLTALEALYYSKRLDTDKNLAGAKDLDWAAAIHFIQSCQNLPAYNKESWASDDPKHRGGFIYYPGNSMAGKETNASGRVALRSYGSISYAGLLSYVYADLKRDDPRVAAVFDWLRQNYTLEENPGMGPQGLFYYLHLMTKALTAYGIDELELKSGAKVNWRKDVAMKLINLQQKDGSWINDNGRWWEKDPVLVTSYSLLALEMIHSRL